MERLSSFIKNSRMKGTVSDLCRRHLWQSQIVEIVSRRFFLNKPAAKLKQHATTTMRLWTQQCEGVIAQRIRRAHQLINLYSQIWEFRTLRALTLGHLARRGGKHLLLASCLAAVFDWEAERIPDEIMMRHMNDIEFVYRLQELTLRCAVCGLRRGIDIAQPSDKYCKCSKPKSASHLAEWEETMTSVSAASPDLQANEWEPFIERPDVLVWRQQHVKHSGLYAYKVYGRYEDVTARDFLKVQLDTEYRREWDPSAVELKVLDSEPQSSCEVIYWEMAWPRLFANRDYVFKRRSLIDCEKKQIVIRSESTNHPDCPPRSGLHRVDEYWSCMVIKPLQADMDKPGIEFCLTYFDNPGLSIPSPVAAWVAMSGLPGFLNSLRQAARSLQEQREKLKVEVLQQPSSAPPPKAEPAADPGMMNSGGGRNVQTHPIPVDNHHPHLLKPTPLSH